MSQETINQLIKQLIVIMYKFVDMTLKKMYRHPSINTFYPYIRLENDINLRLVHLNKLMCKSDKPHLILLHQEWLHETNKMKASVSC